MTQLYLKKQCDFGPRYPGSKAHENLKDYFIEFLEPNADELLVHEHKQKHPYNNEVITLYNIFARYNVDSKDRILLLAHWDTREIADKDLDKKRVSESVETALKIGSGVLYVDKQDEEEKVYSEHLACIDCNISLSELEPRSFSFNTPFGACNKCSGLGFSLEIDPHLIIPDPNNCINNNGISVLNTGLVISSWQKNNFYSIIEELKLNLNIPIRNMHKSLLNLLLYGVVDTDFPNKEKLKSDRNVRMN